MAQQLPFNGRVALVTGGGRGLGRAYALTLAAHGARVAVNNRSAQRATEVVDDITRRGGQAVACAGDLETDGVAREVVDATLKAFGQLDIVVNNAGGVEAPLGSIDATTAAERDSVMRQNFATAWDVTAAAWPHLVSAGYGRIVLCASPMALYGMPGYAHYAAAKAALIGLARTLAVEGAESGIRVNVVNPLANTRSEPGQDAWSRWFESRFSVGHVAAAVAWLVHEKCSATGEIFSLGGTRVARAAILESRGYVDEEPLADPRAMERHSDAVFDGGARLQFGSMGEVLGYWGELYDAPSGRGAS